MKNGTRTIRILIADESAIFREGLRSLLEDQPDFQVVGEVSDGQEAIKLVRRLKPDILLFDMTLPGLSGTQILRQLPSAPEKVRALVVTTSFDKAQVHEALRLGARGIVLHHSPVDVLVRSIRSVADGHYWINQQAFPELAPAFLSIEHHAEPKRKVKKFGLTKRETEVLAAVLSGYTNREISKNFSINENTVKHHLTNIFDKLGVYNRLELALFAIHHELVAGNPEGPQPTPYRRQETYG